MSELDRSKMKRGSIRSSVTKLIKQIDDELRIDDPNVEIIKDSLAILREKELALSKLNEIIESQVDLELLELEVASAMEYSDNVTVCKSRVDRYLKTLGKVRDVSEQIMSVTETVPDARANKQTKLPRISLGTFSGIDVCKFQEWWPQYKAAIHDNDGLHEVEKFNYLKTLLTDSAAAAINGLPLTSQNYEKAVDILVDRFGKKEMLINAHMNRLLNLQPVRRTQDVSALRNLYDEIAIQMRSLESLQLNSDAYGCLLLPVLYKCIPSDLVLQFNRQKVEGKEFNVSDLLNFLKVEIEARERALSVTACGENPNLSESRSVKKFYSNKGFENTAREKPPSAAALNAVSQNHCPFCGGEHKPQNCLLDIPKRKQSLLRQGKCFACFRKYHRSAMCRAKIKCTICQSERHHRSLCEQFAKHQISSCILSQTETLPVPAENIREVEEKIVLTSLLPEKGINSAGTSCVYFQTVRCEAVGKTKQTANIRLLFDSASSRSFLTGRLSRLLNLEVLGTQSLRVHTFGCSEVPLRTLNRVGINLKNCETNEMFWLEALEIENICANVLPAPGVELRNEALRFGVSVSDIEETEGNKDIDILVGSDFYWSLVTGKCLRITQNAVLSETKLGWFLHGRLTNTPNSGISVSAMYMSTWEENTEDGRASTQLQKFWQLESLGIQDDLTHNSSHNQILEQFEKSIQFKNNRYETRLPVKYDTYELPNNYDVARRRFEGLRKRFRRDPSLFEEYKAII